MWKIETVCCVAIGTLGAGWAWSQGDTISAVALFVGGFLWAWLMAGAWDSTEEIRPGDRVIAARLMRDGKEVVPRMDFDPPVKFYEALVALRKAEDEH
jgi:hypothetical protein